jgi:hypothetical protein
LSKINIIKWAAVGLHGIVLAFTLFVTFFLTDGDILTAYELSKTDAALSHALWLSALLIAGNMLGIILLLTPLSRSFIGGCILTTYELAFLGLSFVYLTSDYSFIIGIIVCAVSYVAINQRVSKVSSQ